MACALNGNSRDCSSIWPPKKSPVWKFFSYNIESNQSICEVKRKDKVCGAKIKGKNPTNLKCHLSYHKEEYQFVLQYEEDIKSQNRGKHQFNQCRKFNHLRRIVPSIKSLYLRPRLHVDESTIMQQNAFSKNVSITVFNRLHEDVTLQAGLLTLVN